MEQLIAGLPDIILLIGTFSPRLIGFAMPLFIQLINRKITNDLVKFSVAVVACVIVALMINATKILHMGIGSYAEIEALATFIFAESQIAYWAYFKNAFKTPSIAVTP